MIIGLSGNVHGLELQMVGGGIFRLNPTTLQVAGVVFGAFLYIREQGLTQYVTLLFTATFCMIGKHIFLPDGPEGLPQDIAGTLAMYPIAFITLKDLGFFEGSKNQTVIKMGQLSRA